MRQVAIELQSTKSGEKVKGRYILERRAGEGAPWVPGERMRYRSGGKGAKTPKREFLLEPNERLIVESDGDLIPYYVKEQNAAMTLANAADYAGVELPTLTTLSPASAAIGSADIVMTVTGTGFTEDSVIVFNGGAEETTFISETSISTTVKPSLATVESVVPVAVQTPFMVTDPLDFTFTAAAGAQSQDARYVSGKEAQAREENDRKTKAADEKEEVVGAKGMPDIDINDLSMIGVINDVPAYQLPPEAWTNALNVRYRDRGVEALAGWEGIFGAPLAPPHFVMPMSTTAQQFWIYTSLTKALLYNGVVHIDVSRAAPYTANETWQWNGTILGGIAILNNGVDVPQFKRDMTTPDAFADLTAWPGTLRAKIVRSLAPYLMAFNLTDTALPINRQSLPHTVHWSHPADPGFLPPSWDYADPDIDAGRVDLHDVHSGIIMDALPLRGQMYIYKENSTWRATPIGGRFIFDFKPLFETSGILTQRCVALTGDGQRHVVVTQDDMIWHNGQRVVSILDNRQRTALFAEMSTTDYHNSFLFCNSLASEMWFCYPTDGFTHPNKALIWNYREGGESGVISFADGITFRNAATGNIQENTDERWSDGEDTWLEDTGAWSTFTRRRTLVVSPEKNKFYNLDKGATRDGAVFATSLTREGLSLIGKKRNGEWIVDYKQRKMFQRLWPKVQGGPVNIRIGMQQDVHGPMTWGPTLSYNPQLSRTCDLDPMDGAAVAIEISSDSAVSWRIDGYKIELALLGNF